MNQCCADKQNREVVGRGIATSKDGAKAPSQVERCKVCKRKHYTIFAGQKLEPAQYGVS